MTITKKGGEEVTGRIVEENDERIVVRLNPLTSDTVQVQKNQVQDRQASKISPMPEGLVNILKQEEILDLLAYIESGGKATATAFNAGN
jgi:putative heme-binding domain-containing protein